MKYSGVDLYANNSVVTVTDEESRVVAEKPPTQLAGENRGASHALARGVGGGCR